MSRSLKLLLLAFAATVSAIAPLPFRDRAEEERFQALVEELRCLVCQNQNLADSDAGRTISSGTSIEVPLCILNPRISGRAGGWSDTITYTSSGSKAWAMSSADGVALLRGCE